MTITIGLFLLFGLCLGIASYSNRHLFSEGPTTLEPPEGRRGWVSVVYWLLLCALLWPIMLLTGLNTAWVLAKRKRRQANGSDPSQR